MPIVGIKFEGHKTQGKSCVRGGGTTAPRLKIERPLSCQQSYFELVRPFGIPTAQANPTRVHSMAQLTRCKKKPHHIALLRRPYFKSPLRLQVSPDLSSSIHCVVSPSCCIPLRVCLDQTGCLYRRAERDQRRRVL